MVIHMHLKAHMETTIDESIDKIRSRVDIHQGLILSVDSSIVVTISPIKTTILSDYTALHSSIS